MTGLKSEANQKLNEIVFKEPGEDPAYDSWFREQVQIGIDEAARGGTVSHEAVKARWRKKRAELLRCAVKA